MLVDLERTGVHGRPPCDRTHFNENGTGDCHFPYSPKQGGGSNRDRLKQKHCNLCLKWQKSWCRVLVLNVRKYGSRFQEISRPFASRLWSQRGKEIMSSDNARTLGERVPLPNTYMLALFLKNLESSLSELELHQILRKKTAPSLLGSGRLVSYCADII